MDCHHEPSLGTKSDGTASICLDFDGMTEQSSASASAQGDYNPRAHEFELEIEPPFATVDLARGGLLMDATLSARHIFEVLDGVGDVELRPIHADCRQSLGEDPTGGSYERAPLAILLVSRLLTDEHQCRRSRTFAKYRLRPQPIQRTARAQRGLVTNLSNCHRYTGHAGS